jgi:adenylate cyclase
MSLAAGTPLGSYRIIAPLGAGGMGEVYRAHDPRLGRDVALKVLPADMAGDPARLERFTREARAIAALNHPHIVTIYSTEEADGLRFITMELVEGQALDALIPADGLSLARFLELALPLADALTAAHLRQITHRDLKPANVMVTNDGRVKVLDFGLARVGGGAHVAQQTIEATRPVLTSEGTIVGTMPYMSPEQVEGKALDHRTDLFSLGVMFHEMLTGSRPFSGESSPMLMSSILRDTPASASTVRSEVPEPLGRLILRCLEKRPDDRVQTARDVYNELKHVQKQLESGPRRLDSGAARAVIGESLWVAVLPFTTRGTDAEASTLADGLTEDITAGLTRFASLSVVAPQSAWSFKGSALDVRQIAERLGARYLIGGSVRKSPSGVRITAHLTDATTGAQLWTETYDFGRDERDIYEIQDDVTDRVVATVADNTGVLARSMVQAVRGIPLDQLSARQLVYRCWGAQLQPTQSQHEEVRAALESCFCRQPDEAELWAQLAQAYVFEHSLWFNPLPEPLVRARRAARRAIEIDPSNQEGWLALGLACFHSHDEAGLLEAVDRVLRLNPRASNAVAWMGCILTHSGEYERGCQITGRAMALNASHAGWYHFAFFNRHFARGEFDEALKAAQRVNIAGFHWMHLAIAAAAGHLGLVSEGRAAVEALIAVAPPLADAANLRELVTRWYWNEDVIERLLDGVGRAKAMPADAGPPTSSRPRSSPSAQPSATSAAAPATTSATWIAVIPFAAANDAESQSLADGFTEDITAGLARFSYLSVVAGHSARQHKGSTADARQIGQALGARYLLDGSIRRAGSTLRVSARLVDAGSGAQLWSETYARDLDQSSSLAVQDDVTDRVVATVADVHGVLLRSMSQGLRERPLDTLPVHDVLLRYWSYERQPDMAEHGLLRARLEEIVEAQPHLADAWAALASLYYQEFAHGFNPRAEPLARAHRAVSRALDLDAVHQSAWVVLAITRFFQRDRDGFVHAAERGLSLNPRNTNAMAFLAFLFSQLGETDRACEMTERAMAINPAYPGWYHFVFFDRHYMRGEFAQALAAARRINMPQNLWSAWAVAVSAASLGRAAEATAALEDFLALAPALESPDALRDVTERWRWNVPAHVELSMTGFLKAVALRRGTAESNATGPGGRVAGPSDSGSTAMLPPGHGATWIAVIPFTAANDAESQSLADGLTEDVTSGLARFPNLSVVAAHSARQHKGSTADVRQIGQALGARYLLDGGIRRAGSGLRVVARLVDAVSGAQLWSETYARDLDQSSPLAVQDDVTDRVVATVADVHGVLMRTMSEGVSGRPLESLEPAELRLRYWAYHRHHAPREHGLLRARFEELAEAQPGVAPFWNALAHLYLHEYGFGFNPRPEPLRRAREAVGRALELGPLNQHAWEAQAYCEFFARDRDAFMHAVDRVLTLNPRNANGLALMGILLVHAGEYDRGTALAARAMAINPDHPGWYHFAACNRDYALGDDEGALRTVKRINMPQHLWVHVQVASAAGQLGRWTEAVSATDAVLALSPRFADEAAVREQVSRWKWQEADAERTLDGFRKAMALRAPSRRAEEPRPLASIAVLPFTDLSADRDQAWFCDGIAEEILNALTQLRGLHVAARTSAFSFRDRLDDLRAIADKLGVSAVLQGSVRRAGDRVRITVQLVDAGTGFQHWSDRYDRGLEDIFEVQDEIARAVAGRLKVSLDSAPGRRLVTAHTISLEAYELYLKGRALLLRRGAGILPALDHFRRAVELDADYALAWAGIAETYVVCGYFGLLHGNEVRRQGLAAAQRALALDPNSADAHTSLGGLRWICENDRAGGGASLERALELNPAHVQARCWYALFYKQSALGRFDEGVEEARRAVALDPLSAYATTILAVALITAGQPREGIEAARKGAALDPQSFVARWALGMGLLFAGALDEAESMLEEAAAMSARHHFAVVTLAMTHARNRKPDRARALHAELVERAAAGYIPATQLALSADAAGDREQALAYARQALDDREPPFLLLARHWPDFAGLRQDARFRALLDELAAS